MTAASGSCATLAHVRKGNLHVANVGDGAAVLGRFFLDICRKYEDILSYDFIVFRSCERQWQRCRPSAFPSSLYR